MRKLLTFLTLCSILLWQPFSPSARAQLSIPSVKAGVQSKVVTCGQRILGMDVVMAQANDYSKAFGLAKAAGAQVVSLSLPWDVIEPQPSKFDLQPDNLAIANAYYPAYSTSVLLMIGPVDTNKKRMPSDLINEPLDSPRAISRFKAMLDHVFTRIPNLRLQALSLGNEVDIYLGADAARWKQYQNFFREASAYARAKRPGLVVGVKATWGGLTGASSTFLRNLNAFSDVTMATYYPLDAMFQVRSPSVVKTDFQKLMDRSGKKPIYFMEAGYPSSSVCNSSLEKQAQFVENVFKAWDEYPSRIHLILFNWLSDLSPEAVSQYSQYYGSSDQRFAEYLRTLGLRTYPGSGEDKPAYTTLKVLAKARGW